MWSNDSHTVSSRTTVALSLVLCVVSSSFMLTGCNESAVLSVLPDHEDDQVSWLADELPAFQVQCRTGIGSASVKPIKQSWPDSFNVVLELAALEGFVVRSGEEVHRLEVTREGRLLLEPLDSRVLHMNYFQTKGESIRFSIQINPNNFADTASALRLEWVDYYR